MTSPASAQATLSRSSLSQIDKEIAKYPVAQRQSAVMAALRIAQEEKGWLSTETMDYIAHYLGMPPIAVYEVATFYNMYILAPEGKHRLSICTNVPCALTGANELAQHVKHRLGIGFGETTEDGLFTLKESECMGACGDAPMILVNNKQMRSFLTTEQADALIDQLTQEAAQDRGVS